ncbi:hypothetical protein SAMN05216188_13158 [Lentzea xinjiangensis]|uniref:Major facilitator superfamily (MFS) profile domain-containing protein n=1 Tax=Lentzea xinjiangensis TaxID=402600 RepID=A0A1H9W8Y8_9PSEU|nr:hypothetical protein [Lentzea xinjiangensis]SES30239.1 hypothetical protein SAMN05216188_13158 [Lentzea xinjiangensis]
MKPGLAGALTSLALSGAGTAYQAIMQAEVMGRLPLHVRGSGGGFVRAGLRIGQGVGVAFAGAAAELTGSTSSTLGAAGIVGCCSVVAAALIIAFIPTEQACEKPGRRTSR